VTPIRHNSNQTRWKGLNIKSDIFVIVDVFNRRLVTQLLKVALDYEVDFNRYCRTRIFFIYEVMKHVLIPTAMFFKNETVFLHFWPGQAILTITVYVSQKAYKPSHC